MLWLIVGVVVLVLVGVDAIAFVVGALPGFILLAVIYRIAAGKNIWE